VANTSNLRGVLLAEVASIAFASIYMIREWQVYHNVYANFRPGAVVGDSNYFGVSVVACLPLNYFLIVLPGVAGNVCSPSSACCSPHRVHAGRVARRTAGLDGRFALYRLPFREPPAQSHAHLRGDCPLSLVVPISPLRRLTDPNYSDQAAVRARTIAWNAGVGMIKAHPLIGVGLGNFKARSLYYEDPTRSM